MIREIFISEIMFSFCHFIFKSFTIEMDQDYSNTFDLDDIIRLEPIFTTASKNDTQFKSGQI